MEKEAQNVGHKACSVNLPSHSVLIWAWYYHNYIFSVSETSIHFLKAGMWIDTKEMRIFLTSGKHWREMKETFVWEI